ncbi:MAG TPA: ribonuclease III, partial [Alcanivorax sp.]|nr:ribonuclease III [Alcanivorax sp.]
LSRQFTASGASRRRAEQQAAEQALDWLEQSA